MEIGSTRIVFIFKSVVIKIPNFTHSWQNFLKGLIANMSERRTWKYNSGKYETGYSFLLCPVMWSSWGGWIVVMKRADMYRHEYEIRALPEMKMMVDHNASMLAYKIWAEMRYKEWIEAGFNSDIKVDNFGYYENRLVKIDY